MRTLNQLFDNYTTAKSVVIQLEAAGIPYKDISIVSHRSENQTEVGEGAGIGAGLGAALGAGGGLLAGLGMIAIPGIGPVVAAGWLSATLAGAVGGAVAGGAAGGLIGALIDSGVPDEEAHVYAEGVRRGGTLVSVKVSPEQEPIAQRILADAGGVDVNKRRQYYKEQGWERFDHTSPPYSPEDVELERQKNLNQR